MSDWRANPFHRMRLGESPTVQLEPLQLHCLERLDPRVGDPERGHEIARGVWRLGGEKMPSAAMPPWRAAHPSRHFQARLHSFGWLRDLASIGPSSHAAIRETIQSWAEQFGEWDDLAWDSAISAERLYAWLCWGGPAFVSGPANQRELVARAAARQARLLVLAQNELAQLGAIKGGAALVLAAAAGLPDGERLAEIGEEMLVEACAKQFHPDGGHLSRSPEALAEALRDLVAAFALFAEPTPLLRGAMSKIADMLRLLRMGDGGLACFHGGSESSSGPLEAALSRVEAPPRKFYFAERSGYQRLEAGGAIAVFDVGGAPLPAYSGRAHASALAFEMSSGPERIIVNVGASEELAPNARAAARTTNAHSTLALADALSAELEAPRRNRGAPRLFGPELDDVRRSADESGVTVQGRHDGYRERFGLLHRRYLFMDAEGKNLRGIDELIRPAKLRSPPSRAGFPFAIRFHLHPSVQVRSADAKAIVLETPRGQRWRFRTDAPDVATSPSLYWGGPSPRESLQIVLSGEADPMGHGLAPPNRVRWALARME